MWRDTRNCSYLSATSFQGRKRTSTCTESGLGWWLYRSRKRGDSTHTYITRYLCNSEYVPSSLLDVIRLPSLSFSCISLLLCSFVSPGLFISVLVYHSVLRGPFLVCFLILFSLCSLFSCCGFHSRVRIDFSFFCLWGERVLQLCLIQLYCSIKNGYLLWRSEVEKFCTYYARQRTLYYYRCLRESEEMIVTWLGCTVNVYPR